MTMKQTSFIDFQPERFQKHSSPVTCLGLTFENDMARCVHFTNELHKKLLDPEFRKIGGFPIGSNEDILTLSDPPYYTVCPNPWIKDFITEWETQKPDKPEDYHYHREPFATDVSEGKNDPIYNAHSYHTKVPHKAVMRYILHYTEPGDIVFDGFCGTGMTGVAAQMCGNRDVVMSLGYQVKPDGTILQEEINEDGKKIWKPFSKLGVRRAVLNDLSPAATFIAYNYNTPVDVVTFENEAKRILKEVENECGWMYETLHTDGKTKGKINYTVWSDVFVCPECTKEVIFWDAAVDKKAGKVHEEFPCPYCNANLTKRQMDRAWIKVFDPAINEVVRQAKKKPVLINYTIGKKRSEKIPTEDDLNIIEKIEKAEIPHWFPSDRMIEGKETRRNDPIGITHIHHYYTKRNLRILSTLRSKVNQTPSRSLHYWLNSLDHGLGKRVKHGNYSFPMSTLSGTLYIPSLSRENNPLYFYGTRIKKQTKVLADSLAQGNPISTQSSENIQLDSNIVDYIFLDPPFGSNLNYSELSFPWECWMKIKTDNEPEAIENSVQNKGPTEYRQLMTSCFKEAYRILKPSRWMTVEFSNTKASVWNSIQTALIEAGFIVANVSALDKQSGSFKAVNTPTAVKQDLVISVYKPDSVIEDRFQSGVQTEEAIWDFVRSHLKYLPITKHQGSLLQFIPERDPRILFDQMVAFNIRRGCPVPISSHVFQIGLAQRFSERDGMYFLPDQVAEYDRKKMITGRTDAYNDVLFVKDEQTAIDWLRARLRIKPQTFSDLNPQFMQRLGGWSKNEAQLDLRELLNQNFLAYDGKGPVPEQIHAYLSTNWKELRNLSKSDPTLVAKARDRWYVPDPNKAGDLEKLREKALLKEFEEYKQTKKKLKVFRLEAVRAGFKKAWQEREYAVIIEVADKIPNNVLEEDPKLLMWYDQAVTRMGGE